jgi:hypothetical protein
LRRTGTWYPRARNGRNRSVLPLHMKAAPVGVRRGGTIA